MEKHTARHVGNRMDKPRVVDEWNEDSVKDALSYFMVSARGFGSLEKGPKVELLQHIHVFELLLRKGSMAQGRAHDLAALFVGLVSGSMVGPHPDSGLLLDVDGVRQVIGMFNDTNAISDDDDDALMALVDRFWRFERAVLAGFIEAGEADALARYFLACGHKWLSQNPRWHDAYLARAQSHANG